MKTQHTPRQPEPIIYGPFQPAHPPDNSKDLTKDEKLIFQSILGSLLYYGRMIDSTMLTAINDLSIVQTTATTTSQQHLTMLLDYLFTNPDATILYRKSDMIVKVHSDGSYLSVPGARSRAAGHFYLGNNIPAHQEEPYQGATCQECSIIKPIVASAAECETLTLFLNCQTAIVVRVTAKELGHPQPATPIRVDNTTTNNYVCNNLQQKKSKSFDMRLHWLRDRINNSQFETCWMKGEFNYADYYSKHHPAAHHKKMRSTCLASQVVPKHTFMQRITSTDLSTNTMSHSQQPLSATRGVLLWHGL